MIAPEILTNLEIIFTSIFPVSGALQLKICGAQNERPMISHRYPYSRFERPAPNKRSRPPSEIGFGPSPKINFLALAALSNCN